MRFFLFLLSLPLLAAPPAGGKWQLAFADEFDGDKLDAAKWTYRTGTRFWSDHRLENVTVRGGMLRLALKKQASSGLEYTAGGVISKQEFRYGY